jgi:predicted metal-dependent hydrolase
MNRCRQSLMTCNYVIVHELLQVSVLNLGKLWKSLVRAYLGDYEILEARLNRGASLTKSRFPQQSS